MLEVGEVPAGARALASLRRAGVTDVVAVTGHCASAFAELGDPVAASASTSDTRSTATSTRCGAPATSCAGGCYIVNSDVLFEDEIARRLVAAAGSAVLCASDHGVDEESMKAVPPDGRLA